MPVMIRLFLLTIIVLGACPALKADSREGWLAYEKGDYGAALSHFDAESTPEAHMGACRTGLVIGGFFSESEAMVRALHKALDHCNAARQNAPAMVNAHISYAVAIGLEGKRLKSPRLAKQCRTLLEDHLVVWNDYPELLAALGGWHTQVHEAGFLARVFLGARRAKARHYLEQAVALAPNNVPIRLEHIKFLALGKKDERKQALAAFEAFTALEPRDAFEAFLQDRTAALQAALQADDKDAIRIAVDQVSAFNRIEEMKDLPAYEADGNQAQKRAP